MLKFIEDTSNDVLSFLFIYWHEDLSKNYIFPAVELWIVIVILMLGVNLG
jgi:hypothetical protein